MKLMVVPITKNGYTRNSNQNKMKFRIPRKKKKKIRKGFYLYPLDLKNNTYLSAFPKKNQEDYDAFKKGVLTNVLDEIKKKYKP